MRIISKTGFKSITHGILFDPQKEKKGKDLSSDGHVLEVTEYEEEGVEHYIEAQIVRSTSVTEQRYLTVLHLNHERHVVNTTCTCQANKSEKCKHVFALIHNVNNHDSLTKTDFSQQWGKSSAASFAKEKYSKGRFFYQMLPPSPPTDVESYAVSPDELKEPSALKLMLLESRKDKMDQEIEYLVNSLFKRMEIKINAMNCEGCLNHMFILNKEYLIYEQKVVLSAELQEFYNSHIVLSQKNIIKLCCDTVDQSNCQEWHDVRLMRLSASKKIHSIKRRIKKIVESIAYDMLHQKKVDTKDTRYGLKHEKAAKEEYMKLFSCEVLDVGVIISDNQNWLCASLDGVVIEDNSIKKLLEIK